MKRRVILSSIIVFTMCLVSVFSVGIFQAVQSLQSKPDAAKSVTINSGTDLYNYMTTLTQAGASTGDTVTLNNDITITSLPDTDTVFDGTFDGNGHTITFNCTKRSSASYVGGLFNSLHVNGTIQNVILKNVKINRTKGVSSGGIGGIVGINYGKVENCIIDTLTVYSGSGTYNYIGGISSCNYSGELSSGKKGPGMISACMVIGSYSVYNEVGNFDVSSIAFYFCVINNTFMHHFNTNTEKWYINLLNTFSEFFVGEDGIQLNYNTFPLHCLFTAELHEGTYSDSTVTEGSCDDIFTPQETENINDVHDESGYNTTSKNEMGTGGKDLNAMYHGANIAYSDKWNALSNWQVQTNTYVCGNESIGVKFEDVEYPAFLAYYYDVTTYVIRGSDNGVIREGETVITEKSIEVLPGLEHGIEEDGNNIIISYGADSVTITAYSYTGYKFHSWSILEDATTESNGKESTTIYISPNFVQKEKYTVTFKAVDDPEDRFEVSVIKPYIFNGSYGSLHSGAQFLGMTVTYEDGDLVLSNVEEDLSFIYLRNEEVDEDGYLAVYRVNYGLDYEIRYSIASQREASRFNIYSKNPGWNYNALIVDGDEVITPEFVGGRTYVNFDEPNSEESTISVISSFIDSELYNGYVAYDSPITYKINADFTEITYSGVTSNYNDKVTEDLVTYKCKENYVITDPGITEGLGDSTNIIVVDPKVDLLDNLIRLDFSSYIVDDVWSDTYPTYTIDGVDQGELKNPIYLPKTVAPTNLNVEYIKESGATIGVKFTFKVDLTSDGVNNPTTYVITYSSSTYKFDRYSTVGDITQQSYILETINGTAEIYVYFLDKKAMEITFNIPDNVYAYEPIDYTTTESNGTVHEVATFASEYIYAFNSTTFNSIFNYVKSDTYKVTLDNSYEYTLEREQVIVERTINDGTSDVDIFDEGYLIYRISYTDESNVKHVKDLIQFYYRNDTMAFSGDEQTDDNNDGVIDTIDPSFDADTVTFELLDEDKGEITYSDYYYDEFQARQVACGRTITLSTNVVDIINNSKSIVIGKYGNTSIVIGYYSASDSIDSSTDSSEYQLMSDYPASMTYTVNDEYLGNPLELYINGILQEEDNITLTITEDTTITIDLKVPPTIKIQMSPEYANYSPTGHYYDYFVDMQIINWTKQGCNDENTIIYKNKDGRYESAIIDYPNNDLNHVMVDYYKEDANTNIYSSFCNCNSLSKIHIHYGATSNTYDDDYYTPWDLSYYASWLGNGEYGTKAYDFDFVSYCISSVIGLIGDNTGSYRQMVVDEYTTTFDSLEDTSDKIFNTETSMYGCTIISLNEGDMYFAEQRSSDYYRNDTYNGIDILLLTMSRIFGYSDVDTFVLYANNLASALKDNPAEASTDTTKDRLKYNGAVYTDSNTIIYPYIVNNGTLEVCMYIYIDSNGKIYLVVEDMDTAYEIAGIRYAYYSYENKYYWNETEAEERIVVRGLCDIVSDQTYWVKCYSSAPVDAELGDLASRDDDYLCFSCSSDQKISIYLGKNVSYYEPKKNTYSIYLYVDTYAKTDEGYEYVDIREEWILTFDAPNSSYPSYKDAGDTMALKYRLSEDGEWQEFRGSIDFPEGEDVTIYLDLQDKSYTMEEKPAGS